MNRRPWGAIVALLLWVVAAATCLLLAFREDWHATLLALAGAVSVASLVWFYDKIYGDGDLL